MFLTVRFSRRRFQHQMDFNANVKAIVKPSPLTGLLFVMQI